MEYLEIKAPAKINLGLFILSKREDGFHNLSTLFYPVCDLFDKMTFRKSHFPFFNCAGINAGNDEDNLVVRARKLLEQHTGKSLNVEINLEKHIPVGGGLGGGSSDAATALVSLNEFFSLNISFPELCELALKLGSDVPFFLKAKPAIGKSRGEILEEIDLQINDYIVIVNPRIHVSTKEAFAGIVPKNSEIDFHSLIINGKPDYEVFRKYLTNDFEENIFRRHPEIGMIKEKMYAGGAMFSLMSGSGSTVYGIFDNPESADKTAASFPPDYFTFVSSPKD